MASARNNRRRRRGRGRLGPLFKLLCVLAVIVALTMGATVFFQVETVVVSGNSRYTEEVVVRATGIQVGDNLYRMNKNQIADKVLRELPYTRDLRIRRSLPSTIIITMTEWEAVARVKAPPAGTQVSAAAAESAPEGDGSSQENAPEVASEDWLISVGGKLLEPAPADSTAIEVSGVTPLMPRAGTMLALPQEEQPKYDALLALLAALEERGMMGAVESIRLESTQVVMGYLGRFQVKMPLNSDFDYKLRALEAAVAETEKTLGDQTSGTFDLTQEECTAVYSPD
ncbi:cell division protein FtsQ/DivIB [Pseudoflavonifractor phocaeensis]|uniref:cell division protein FtsQ/DivIB n=1 Tax=Pseudoflavonifractor phocaeensis TaxID=1870988 RepID=UPI001F395098|nr:FtsQ-type POTRA domain-containing protein [Pseudoflavonifractor phocaeensis]MCF2662178.1 FtsQ-type POTRA domain-containing protein [Pseudoflavonifractor phocaeensis]